jgi:hypothetical protein
MHRPNQLTVIVPLDKGRRQPLERYLERRVGYQHAATAKLLARITQLHFVSMFTFVPPSRARLVNPEGYLVIEASFDGPADGFVREFTTTFGRKLRVILGCCGYRANESLAEFIRRYCHNPECFYVSCPDLTGPQISAERELRERLQKEVDIIAGAGPAASRDYKTVLERVREVGGRDGLLDNPPRPSFLVSYGKTLVTALGVLVPMALLALAVAATGRWPSLQEIPAHSLLVPALAITVGVVAYGLAKRTGVAIAAVILFGTLMSIAGAAAITRILPDDAFIAARFALAGIAVAAGALALALYRIELLERHDAIDPGWLSIDHMRNVCRDENAQGCIQNHFANLSVLKPGALRLWTLRLVLRAVHLLGRLYFNRGEMGGVAVIHTARWVILGEQEFGVPMLLFLINYDGAWDPYIGDFVDTISQGISGIWSNTGGFPRTRGLFLDGGSRFEKQFKAYARNGQQRSLGWFTAYPNVSVQEKLGNAELRRALAERPDRLTLKAQDKLLRRL